MHTVQLPLKTTSYDNSEIQKRFYALSHVHNICVKHARKLLIQLEHDKEYQTWRNEYLSLRKKEKLSKSEKTQKSKLSKQMKDRRISIGLSEYAFQDYLKVCGKRYKKLLSSQQVQSESGRVWKSVENYLFGRGKAIHYKKQSDFQTIGGKSNLNGARFHKDGMLVTWLGLELKCKLPKKDADLDYILESLDHKIKYCQIKRMMFSSGWRYYAILVLDGDAPRKERTIGTGIMGIDPGISTVACVADDRCFLEELAPRSCEYDKQIQKLQQHMDHSRHVYNPTKFNPDGTINRENHDEWIFSSHYKKMQRQLRSLYRKRSAYVLCEHRKLCNTLLSHADTFIVEKMNFAALQKRAKETQRQDKQTEVTAKSGKKRLVFKCKKKRRFGSSINRRSPARFLLELEYKVVRYGGVFCEADTQSFKASQYDHVKDAYIKVSLSQRMKVVGTRTVQRDLYSAFLLKNADARLEHADREKCEDDFERFADIQDRLINDMRLSGVSMKQCFGF